MVKINDKLLLKIWISERTAKSLIFSKFLVKNVNFYFFFFFTSCFWVSFFFFFFFLFLVKVAQNLLWKKIFVFLYIFFNKIYCFWKAKHQNTTGTVIEHRQQMSSNKTLISGIILVFIGASPPFLSPTLPPVSRSAFISRPFPYPLSFPRSPYQIHLPVPLHWQPSKSTFAVSRQQLTDIMAEEKKQSTLNFCWLTVWLIKLILKNLHLFFKKNLFNL